MPITLCFIEKYQMNKCLMLACASVHLPGCISFGDQGKFTVSFGVETVTKTEYNHIHLFIFVINCEELITIQSFF